MDSSTLTAIVTSPYDDVDSLISPAAANALIATASARFGPITTLFNNAAIFDMAPLLESDEAMYDKLFSVNVKGAFFVMQKVLAHMVAAQTQGASVINMASQAGRRGEALVSHYCASKAAIISYTQSAALAMAPRSCEAGLPCTSRTTRRTTASTRIANPR